MWAQIRRVSIRLRRKVAPRRAWPICVRVRNTNVSQLSQALILKSTHEFICATNQLHIMILDSVDEPRLYCLVPAVTDLIGQLMKLGTHTTGRDTGLSTRRPVRDRPTGALLSYYTIAVDLGGLPSFLKPMCLCRVHWGLVTISL